MSIIGVTLVLFLLGLVGWLVINANKLGDYFRENVEVRTFLRGDLAAKDSTALVQYIASKPYINSYEFVTKESAKQKYLEDGNEDWEKVLDFNPLPNSINFKLKKDFVNVDTLEAIKADLEQNVNVSSVQYPKALVTSLDKNIRQLSIWLLVIAKRHYLPGCLDAPHNPFLAPRTVLLPSAAASHLASTVVNEWSSGTVVHPLERHRFGLSPERYS